MAAGRILQVSSIGGISGGPLATATRDHEARLATGREREPLPVAAHGGTA